MHVGTYTIDANDDHSNDGDYVFQVEYKDRSNNEMTSYTSGVKVIDTTKPVINVEYSNSNVINELTDTENHTRKYFASAQTATITINEHNFNPGDVNYTIVAKDVAGNELNASSLYTTSSWTSNGDNNIVTITYPGDANYTFDIAYTDLATIEADDFAEQYFTVDTSKPSDLKVTYSTSLLDTVLNAITFGFYNAKATVTISATDNITGIYSMKYSYVKADGVSGVNTELVDATIDASSITNSNGGAVGTTTFEIPRSALAPDSQFNGTVNFTAIDRANNESDYLRDTKRIIVDNIAPNAEVQYNTPVQVANGVSYYDGDITATVTVHEANFYSEDVQLSVTRDGAPVQIAANWSDNSTDVHVGTFTLSGDGDYMVGITYSDKSTNAMQEYTSEQMTIDTEITEATITVNGQEADGKAFKDEVVPAVSFEDKNFESCDVKISRTSFADKNVDVTDKFVAGHISTNETGGNGSFDTFEKVAENDGIYTMTVELKDKAGHSIEKSATFTVNRFGSVYEYSDYLVSMIAEGGAYVQSVEDDFVITEYNADRLVKDSLNIEISRDGKPLENSDYSVTPDINENVTTGASGWFQYTYTISKDNFASDGVYKIAVSSKDNTGNSPENTNYDDNQTFYKEFEIPAELERVKLGSTSNCEFRLNSDFFFEDIEISLEKKENWNILCSDNLYISRGDVRKLLFSELTHDDVVNICYVNSGEVAFEIRFLIDFGSDGTDYSLKIDLSQISELSIGDKSGANIELSTEYGKDTFVSIVQANNKIELIEKASKYGTYVNGKRISKKAVLKDFDFISVADFSAYYKDKQLYFSKRNIRLNGISQIVEQVDIGGVYPMFIRNTRAKSVIEDEKIKILDPDTIPTKPELNIVTSLMPTIVMFALVVVLRGIMSESGGTYVIFSICSMGMGVITSVLNIVHGQNKYKKNCNNSFT